MDRIIELHRSSRPGPWADPNQTVGNVSGSGNVETTNPPVYFSDSGYAENLQGKQENPTHCRIPVR